MVKRFAVLTLLLFAACGQKQAPEKTYPMTATIVSRDVTQNSVMLDNRDVPGVMEPMRMEYQVRGANVSTLPENGTSVQVTLHVSEGQYWVTDFKVTK